MPKKIVQKGDPVLRGEIHAVPLEKITSSEIRTAIKNMSDALRESSNGIGIAAPQIGLPLAIFLVSEEATVSNSHIIEDAEGKSGKKPWKHFVFINPKLIKGSRKKELMAEGCLSVEGVFGRVNRSRQVTVEAYDETGKKFRTGASGLFAQVLQHEIDHLNGILFVDKAEGLEKISDE